MILIHLTFLPYFPIIDFLYNTLYSLFTFLWIGERLHEPEFAMLHKLGMKASAGYSSIIIENMP